MENVIAYYDHTGRTLTVWFDDPKQEFVCQEIEDDMVLMKDWLGRVIGFERLNYQSQNERGDSTGVPVEVQML